MFMFAVILTTFLGSTAYTSAVPTQTSQQLLRPLPEVHMNVTQIISPEVHMNVTQIIAYHGYPFEIHDVTTADGYILTVVRIPHGRGGGSGNRKGPVFLQHGLMDSATTWLMNSPAQSLGFILADAGYDVWMGNSRGNTYSRKHVKLTTSDNKFWEFSFEELAAYDLPASIDHVLKVTGVTSLPYIGHSQGTTIGFVEFGRNTVLANKIKAFYALAPVAQVSHAHGLFKVLGIFYSQIVYLFKLFGVREFAPSNWFTKILARWICPGFTWACSNLIFMVAGFNRANLNATRIPVMVAHVPAGTSVRNVVHLSQMTRSGSFRMYDYGVKGNRIHYAQDTPLEYTPEKIQIPVVLYSGVKDWLAPPKDVQFLKNRLPNIVGAFDYKEYNHLDMVWGKDAAQVVYADIRKRLANL